LRRYLILAPGEFAENAKTAQGVIRYSSDETVAVVDPTLAGKSVREVAPHLSSDAPIVASVADGLRFNPTALLIGTAPQGGRLPPAWRAEVLAAIAAGLEIVSGLHDMLGADAAFAAAARAAGTTIWDVREPPETPLFSGAAYAVKPPVLLLVGNDCAVGKMTVAIELCAAAKERGTDATFVPTGQTGIMIAGWGIAVDRVIGDFGTGAAEQLVVHAAKSEPDLIVVEGQGAINHPAYAPVTLSLMYGCAPDALLLVCEVPHATIPAFGTPVLDYGHLIAIHEALLATVKPARVVGIALNTRTIADDADACKEIARAHEETGLPADDVVRFGSKHLYDALPAIAKRQPLSEARS
jgi:uncharacterized NAD-dependent epimerase/dehydratase family protein